MPPRNRNIIVLAQLYKSRCMYRMDSHIYKDACLPTIRLPMCTSEYLVDYFPASIMTSKFLNALGVAQ